MQQTQQTLQSQNTITQLPGVPLGFKAVGYRPIRDGEYRMISDGTVLKYIANYGLPSVGFALVVKPDNVYNAIDLKAVPIPKGYERDGNADKPETWYRELTAPHADRATSVTNDPGTIVLGFDGNAYTENYNIHGADANRHRIFLRKLKPANAYGVDNLSTVPVPQPDKYERDGTCEAEWLRYPKAYECYISVNLRKSEASFNHSASFTGDEGCFGPRIILRLIPPRTKQILVGEWELSEAAISDNDNALGCHTDFAKRVLREGSNRDALLKGKPGNYRIETRPA